MKRFAIIGVGGYIAPRHLKAIKDTGNIVVAALDKNDSVGIIDSYFPEADFFTEFERFDRHLDLRRREGKEKVDFVSICSPNYLHDAHVRFALRIDADAICEKPLVLNPRNVAALEEIEKETGHRINTILQLRLHPAIIALKQQIDREPKGRVHDIELTYITSRGHWYHVSWKGDINKSGGVATNIGIHFFDMLTWIFGDVRENIVNLHSHTKAAGVLELERARVKWFLSLDHEDLPDRAKAQKVKTYRSVTLDGKEIEFSEGFSELHTKSYEQILNGRGFTTKDVLSSIKIVAEIRNAKQVGLLDDCHPMLKQTRVWAPRISD
jgi:UDP-N-acetyl-2-amino-2-deoxyglucuronate dehydrogenase